MTEKKKRGFASMSREENKRISSLGGKKAHELGTAHKWNKDSAREAGQKGGKAVSANKQPADTTEAPAVDERND